jgi:N-acetylmuramoyl-L-alanine amidase CwlA
LSDTENFIPLSRDTKLIDYQNAQIILIGAREGPDVIKNEIGVEINYDRNGTTESSSADIFAKLKVRKDQIPTRPLIEGILE